YAQPALARCLDQLRSPQVICRKNRQWPWQRCDPVAHGGATPFLRSAAHRGHLSIMRTVTRKRKVAGNRFVSAGLGAASEGSLDLQPESHFALARPEQM